MLLPARPGEEGPDHPVAEPPSRPADEPGAEAKDRPVVAGSPLGSELKTPPPRIQAALIAEPTSSFHLD